MVRLGKVNDGGYVIPKGFILEVDTLVSLGVSTDWSFDQHFKRLNPQIQIHVYDHTISENFFSATLLHRRGAVPAGEDFTHGFERAMQSYQILPILLFHRCKAF